MKVYLDMVGCRLNQSELENFAYQFRLAGHTLTSTAETADLVVINTCTVTSAAASDSRQKIRQAARSGVSKIVVTGCWATMNPHETAQLAGVSQVVLNQAKDDLVQIVLNQPIIDVGVQIREPIPGGRLRTRAFIKVQDGCDNFCTYCITRLARGAGRSNEISHVLADAFSALAGGAQEIILTGVHLGSWGHDLAVPSHLEDLISVILKETDVKRLRLSSIEPWDITPGFFELWQDPRLCRHLHLPLQSGCAATLHRMGRRISPGSFANLVEMARSIIPGVAITTDIITGFPGETEVEFAESAAFVDAMDFAGGHVFTFSPWPGTPAATLPNQVLLEISRQRNTHIREILNHSSATYRQKQVGRILQVLWEKTSPIDGSGWQLSGLSDNYIRVRANFSSPRHNQVMNVRITGEGEGELTGDILEGESQLLASQDTI